MNTALASVGPWQRFGEKQMSKPKHTSGSWEAIDRTVATTDKYRRIVAECGQSTSHEVDQANAKLIAAAPEMLEALKSVAAFIDLEFGSHPQGDAIEKVILKAEGREE
jgi:hypothetical protein